MEYNNDYVVKSIEGYTTLAQALQGEETSVYSLDLGDGTLNFPPLPTVFRFTNPTVMADPIEQELIAKHCFRGQTVVVKLDGVRVGAFVLNSVTDNFDAFDVLRDHPLAYSLLINTAVAFVLKKCTPPRKQGSATVTARA